MGEFSPGQIWVDSGGVFRGRIKYQIRCVNIDKVLSSIYITKRYHQNTTRSTGDRLFLAQMVFCVFLGVDLNQVNLLVRSNLAYQLSYLLISVETFCPLRNPRGLKPPN